MEKNKARIGLEGLFLGLMKVIRPLLGPEGMCIFPHHTCTLFAADQLRTQTLPKALLAIIKRLLACNPINGYLRYRKWKRDSA